MCSSDLSLLSYCFCFRFWGCLPRDPSRTGGIPVRRLYCHHGPGRGCMEGGLSPPMIFRRYFQPRAFLDSPGALRLAGAGDYGRSRAGRSRSGIPVLRLGPPWGFGEFEACPGCLGQRQNRVTEIALVTRSTTKIVATLVNLAISPDACRHCRVGKGTRMTSTLTSSCKRSSS